MFPEAVSLVPDYLLDSADVVERHLMPHLPRLTKLRHLSLVLPEEEIDIDFLQTSLQSLDVGYADVTSPATAIRTVASAKNHPGALTIGRDGCSPLTCCYNNGRLMVVERGQEFTAVALEVRESPTTAST